jgi:hypothetical protein
MARDATDDEITPSSRLGVWIVMFDLTVVAKGARWVLVDDEAGELGDFASRAEALRAAGDYAAGVAPEARHVLIQEAAGEWEEAVVEPPRLH